MRKVVLVVGGLISALALAGCAARPVPAAATQPHSRSRIPVLAIAAHGVFAATALLLVLLAAIGAG